MTNARYYHSSFGADSFIAGFSDPNTISGIHTTLSGAGVDPNNVDAAALAYQALPQSAHDAVGTVIDKYNSIPAPVLKAAGGLLSSGHLGIAEIMPLVSMGLAATGVGAPVAGLVAAAVPIAETLGHALNLFPAPGHIQHCTWVVRDTSLTQEDMQDLQGGEQPSTDWSAACFTGKRPYGPTDPLWTKYGDFLKKQAARKPGKDGKWPTDMRIGLLRVGMGGKGSDIEMIAYNGNPPKDLVAYYKKKDAVPQAHGLWDAPKPVRDFASLYYAMLEANAEMALNGHPHASASSTLRTAIMAWNLKHGPPMLTISGNGYGWLAQRIIEGSLDPNTRQPSIQIGSTDIPAPPPPKKVIRLQLGTPKTTQQVVQAHVGVANVAPVAAAKTAANINATVAKNTALLTGGPTPAQKKNALLMIAGGAVAGLAVVGGPIGIAIGAGIGWVAGKYLNK